jgi:uncharacterized protein YjiS (DUF1127 family)
MATLAEHPLTISHRVAAPARVSLWDRLSRLATAWNHRRQARHAFAKMTERDLGDAGIARWEIERELARPFWRD